MDEELRKLYEEKKAIEQKIKDYENSCPHDQGVVGPNKIRNMRTGPRIARCIRCGKSIGPWCEKSPTHICEYNTKDGHAYDWHDKCIHCGLLFED